MAYSYEQILQAQYTRIDDELAQAAADLEAGRRDEDAFRTNAAADRILDLDKSREALDRRTHGYVAAQQQPQGNQYGLSKDQVDVAHTIGQGDPKLTNADRERIYAENRAKYQRMRATGEYSDQGGRLWP